jgi:site-specific DNA recombinase
MVIPWRKPPSKRPREIILPAGGSSHRDSRPIRSEARVRLVTAIAKGRRWLDALMAGTVTNIEQIAAAETCTVRQVSTTISLAFLAPNLVQAAVEGRLPRGSASQTCAMRRPNGRGSMRGLGWRHKRFIHLPTLRQEQDFSGQRPGPEFGISRLPDTGRRKPRVE